MNSHREADKELNAVAHVLGGLTARAMKSRRIPIRMVEGGPGALARSKG